MSRTSEQTHTTELKKNDMQGRSTVRKTDAIIKSFSEQDLLDIYRTMLMARKLDEKMLIMLKQGKSFFHIAGAGHEAAQIAVARSMIKEKDWAYPYYRDLAFVLSFGETPHDIVSCFLARECDPNSGGRQMPAHYGKTEARIVSQSSPTGTQYLQAVGTALGAVKEGLDEVVYVSSGEGTTSQGDFHEALNWASREKLPVIFCVEDNKYAISVPVSQQMAHGSVYDMVGGYRNLARFKVDGTDFFASYEAFSEAVERARNGEGPSVVVADVVRLFPHSSSDDQRKYRSEGELEQDRLRDPIARFEQSLISFGTLNETSAREMQAAVKQEIDRLTGEVENLPMAEASTALRFLFSEEPDSNEYEATEPNGENVVLVDAINHALKEEMERNPRMLIFGEDVEDPKGGVFTATKGITTMFGRDRCFNSPLAESSIVGTAIGLSIRGFKPVVEIQFGDYIWTAMMQVRNELATMRYRSNNAWSAPVVLRVPVGGYIHGALYHSQSIDGIFAHIPGLKIAYPSNAADAKGLLKTACRLDDPVLFLEHKGLYRQGYASSPEPDRDYLLPFGKAKTVRSGSDLTIVTWGALVQKSLEAARLLAKENISVEVVDLRTLIPWDVETILESVRKTGKVLVVHEDTITGGFGAEIASRIVSDAFEFLDAPVQRLGAKDCHVPYSWVLEPEVLPQDRDIIATARRLADY